MLLPTRQARRRQLTAAAAAQPARPCAEQDASPGLELCGGVAALRSASRRLVEDDGGLGFMAKF